MTALPYQRSLGSYIFRTPVHVSKRFEAASNSLGSPGVTCTNPFPFLGFSFPIFDNGD